MSITSYESIASITAQPIAASEKLLQLIPIVLDPFGGDVCKFISNLGGETCEYSKVLKVLKILAEYNEFAESFACSSSLQSALLTVSAAQSDSVNTEVLNLFSKGFTSLSNGHDSSDLLVANFELMVPFAVSGFASSDLSLAEVSASFLGKSMQTRPSQMEKIVNLIYTSSQSFKEQTRSNGTIFMRYMSFLVKSCSINDDSFRACESAGAVADIVELCKYGDILVQIVAIELLEDIASTRAGLIYLCDHQVVAWLVTVACGTLVTSSTDSAESIIMEIVEPDPLLSSQALRVLGAVLAKAVGVGFDLASRVSPDMLYHFLRCIRGYFEDGDESQRLAGLVVLSDLARLSVGTLQLVLEGDSAFSSPQQPAQQTLLGAWLALINVGKAELNAALLRSVAVVLEHPDDKYLAAAAATVAGQEGSSLDAGITVFTAATEAKTSSSSDSNRGSSSADRESVIRLKKSLYFSLGAAKRGSSLSTSALLLKLARQPVDSVRHAAMDMLRAVAEQQSVWGLQQLFHNNNGCGAGGGGGGGGDNDDFFSYLQDRSTEYSKEGKDWKFSIILAVHLSPVKSLLADEVVAKIESMVGQGPYFMPAAMGDVQTLDG